MVPFRSSLAAMNFTLNPNFMLAPCGRSGLRIRMGFLLASILTCCRIMQAADTDAILDAWLDAQTKLHSWQADFTQTRTMKTLVQPLVATGHVWFMPANRFRWELGRPPQTIAIRSADEMFIIYPLLKRAERYPVDEEASGEWREMLSLLEAGFARDRKELESRFHIRSVTDDSGTLEVVLQPASTSARRVMKEIKLGVATNDYSLASTEMIFVDGSKMRNDFTNAVLNSTFNEKMFEWKPPHDFKVTEPLKR